MKREPQPRVISRFLLRAPALAFDAALHNEADEAVLVDNALALAGAEPGDAATPARIRAQKNYRARMSFRPTPSGLFAGVAVGTLGDRTDIRTGVPRGRAGTAHLHVTWARAASLARALLDDPAVRAKTKLRAAPSLFCDETRAMWLAPGRGAEAVVERAVLDPMLAAVFFASHKWTSWSHLRRAAGEAGGGDDRDALDEYLLTLVDGGLLLSSLRPPAVGLPPLDHVARQLPTGHAAIVEIAALQQCLVPRDAADPALPRALEEARGILDALPGATPSSPPGGSDRILDGILALHPTSAVLSREAVDRAARVAATVFRLQAAFAPTWERATSPALDDGVRALLEHHEPGAFDLASLALGRYAVTLGEAAPATFGGTVPRLAGPAASHPVAPALLALFVERLAEGGEVVAFTTDELDRVLPPADLPPTFELVLAPCREPDGAPPGTDWLLGLHGPAGATWGRFAHALPDALRAAFDELVSVEESLLSPALACDLEFAPGAAVADVACHPPLRASTLCLTGWAEGSGNLTPANLALDLDGRLFAGGVSGAPEALGLRTTSGQPLRVAQLARIRSTTVAEDGLYRLLAGFALQRATHSWALHPGPLARLARLPRVVVDGFVIAPASFGLPEKLLDACSGPGATEAIARFRRDSGAPTRIQIGEGDLLLPLDLTDRESAGHAAAALARLPRDGSARAWEIWPPIDRISDEDGRRVEAVVAVVRPARDDHAALQHEVARSSRDAALQHDGARLTGDAALQQQAGFALVDPRPDPDWITFLLHGARDRADAVLAECVGPAVTDGLAWGDIDSWFFLRYVDESGRDHLRLRVRGGKRGGPDLAPFERLLDEALVPMREAGDIVSVERADYRPERARYGGARAMPLVEEVFRADSELVLGLLGVGPELLPDGLTLLVRSFDALSAGLGFAIVGDGERQAIAAAARDTHQITLAALSGEDGVSDPLAQLYRDCQPELLAALDSDERGSPEDPSLDPVTACFAAHRHRLALLRPALRRAGALRPQVIASLLHLAAVRLAGIAPESEAAAAYLFQRATESRAARSRKRRRKD